MTYLLDSDTCIYAMKRFPVVVKRFASRVHTDLAISVIVEAELRTGAAKSRAPIDALRVLENFLTPVTVVDFNSTDAVYYADIRARLERAGTPTGPLDTLIAAQAVARRLTLVTNNEREFKRVAGLRIENWTR